jgi:hypothetical protein
VTSYSVIWHDGVAESGRLELDPHGLVFDGSHGRHTVFFEDIESVRVGRSPAERIAGRPVLVLERHVGKTLRIGSLDGLGALNELTGTLARLLATPLAV